MLNSFHPMMLKNKYVDAAYFFSCLYPFSKALFSVVLFTCILFLGPALQAYPQKLPTIDNPVLPGVADAGVIKFNGEYYLGGVFTNGSFYISKDLIEWEGPVQVFSMDNDWTEGPSAGNDQIHDALPEQPSWADRDFWAPHVLYDSEDQTYYMYYSGESVESAIGKCMGVATSKNPEGPFVDKGQSLLCGEGFIEIDPMAFDDPATGNKFLYWGSGHEAIKVQELADSRTDFKPGSQPIDLIDTIADDHSDNYQKLVEGAWVVYRDGFYFLFYSGDNCCGENAHYAVMVARSKKATGPFESLAEATGSKNSVILEGNGKWLATGHNSVIMDSTGQDWMAYHVIDSTDKEKGRVMLMDKIIWNNGWPQIIKGN
ncbi:MAG: glycoside hydrolase family 43 protein [Anditalea sp.]